MIDYKLVPVDPTPEMVEAARQHHEGEAYLPVSLYKAMLAAAPAVQGEPVAWMTDESWRRLQGGGNDSRGTVPVRSKRTSVATIPLYTAPQPAGAALPPEITREMLGMIIDEVFGGGIEDASVIEDIYRVIARSATPHPAEQQPDVTRLVEHQSPSSYPVSGNVFFRDSTGEWVLELTGSVNGTTFTARHTQPADTRPEDVAGLPALYESTPDITQLVEAAAAALDEIEAIMHEAYNSAEPVCCGRAGSECCGSPDPEWDEVDQRIMDRLSPHQRALNDALAAHHKGGRK